MADFVLQGGVSTTTVVGEEPDKNKTPSGSYLEYGDNKYYFDIITRESYEAHTKTTDHYLEDGFTMQDHAVDMPVYYTLSGLIGEKVHEYTGEPSAKEYVARAKMQDALRRFQTFAQISPTMSNYIYSAINTGRFVANRITNILKSAQSLFGTTVITDTIRNAFEDIDGKTKFGETITGMYGLTKKEFNAKKKVSPEVVKRFITDKQKQRVAEFEVLRKKHAIMVLHTPYGELEHVVIEDLSCGQDKYWSSSDITITVKQINKVGEWAGFTREFDPSINPFDPVSQRSSLVKNGSVVAKVVDTPEIYYTEDGAPAYINDMGMEIIMK